FSGAGRVQVQEFRMQNTKIVGMSFEEAQKLFKESRIETDPLSGAITVWDMPPDVRLNPNYAYNTDPTLQNFHPVGQEPTGKYFAPAVGPDCFGLVPGSCAADLFMQGAWYSEWDVKLVKRFPFGRKASVDFNVEVFNVFNTSNFTRNLNPSASANNFRITAQQSGARIGQLVWRVNF